MSKTVQFQIIQFSISTQFKCKYSLIVKNISISSYSVLIQLIQFSISTDFVYTHLHVKTIPCQTIQYSVNTGATTPGQSEPGRNGNEGVLCIRQSPSITGTSPSDCLVSYPGHSLVVGSYPSAEVQSVYSTAPTIWAIHRVNVKTVLFR